jgi:hypothetical protein
VSRENGVASRWLSLSKPTHEVVEQRAKRAVSRDHFRKGSTHVAHRWLSLSKPLLLDGAPELSIGVVAVGGWLRRCSPTPVFGAPSPGSTVVVAVWHVEIAESVTVVSGFPEVIHILELTIETVGSAL